MSLLSGLNYVIIWSEIWGKKMCLILKMWRRVDGEYGTRQISIG